MARKFTGGAEFNAGATADLDYDSTSGSTITYDTTTVRSGGFSWKFVTAATGPFLTRQYNSGNHNSFVRAYILVSSMTTASSISICLIRDAVNGNNLDIRLTRVSAGTFTLALSDEQNTVIIGTSGTLNTNTWYRVEFSYNFTTGAANAYVDGVNFASGTASLSIASDTLRWGSLDNSTMTLFFDDIAVNDETGSFQTGLPGSGKVIRLLPDSAGDVNTFATQTGGTAGAANNFTRVNEVKPDDATTFNGSNTLNQEDLLNNGASGIGATDTVNVVEVWGRYRNNVADAATTVKFEIEKTTAGTILQSTGIIPNSTTFRMNAGAVPKIPPLVTYQDPDSAAWTQITLDSMQIGYKITTGGTNRVDVTNVSALVDYTPAVVVTASGETMLMMGV